jgi:hypothetical protein
MEKPMPQAQQQRELIASLNLESLFDYGDLGEFASRTTPAGLAPHREAHASQRQLGAMLSLLGLSMSAAMARGAADSTAARERAISNIATWLAYLPKECIRSMVRDGWHWTT